MPAHIRTVLTSSTLSLSVNNSQLALGVWQAIYLWEHRYSSHSRKLNLHALGQCSNNTRSIKNQNLASLTSRTNPSKINKAISHLRDNLQTQSDNSSDTDIDVLIDRIHHLISQNEDS